MRSTIVLLTIAVSLVFAGCQKDDTADNRNGIDTKKYETSLTLDYSNALQYHNALNSAYSDNHLPGNTAQNNTQHYILMFHVSDSLFSEHFYDFCLDIAKYLSTAGNGNGMGNNYSMMGGNGGMMNGFGPLSASDQNEMINYMNEVHNSNLNHSDYMITDSLMFNQLIRCRVFSDQTDSIEGIYKKMQELRAIHRMSLQKIPI